MDKVHVEVNHPHRRHGRFCRMRTTFMACGRGEIDEPALKLEDEDNEKCMHKVQAQETMDNKRKGMEDRMNEMELDGQRTHGELHNAKTTIAELEEQLRQLRDSRDELDIKYRELKAETDEIKEDKKMGSGHEERVYKEPGSELMDLAAKPHVFTKILGYLEDMADVWKVVSIVTALKDRNNEYKILASMLPKFLEQTKTLEMNGAASNIIHCPPKDRNVAKCSQMQSPCVV